MLLNEDVKDLLTLVNLINDHVAKITTISQLRLNDLDSDVVFELSEILETTKVMKEILDPPKCTVEKMF